MVRHLPKGNYRTTPQLAKAVGVSRQTIYGWMRKKNNPLKAIRFGATFRIYDDHWDEFMEGNNGRDN